MADAIQNNTIKPDTAAIKAIVEAAASQARMATQIDYLVKSVDGLTVKMDSLPNSYPSMKDFTDLKATYETSNKALEDKIDTIQKYMWMGLGALSLLTIILQFIKLH